MYVYHNGREIHGPAKYILVIGILAFILLILGALFFIGGALIVVGIACVAILAVLAFLKSMRRQFDKLAWRLRWVNEENYIRIGDIEGGPTLFVLNRVFPELERSGKIRFAEMQYGHVVRRSSKRLDPRWAYVRKSDVEPFKQLLKEIEQKKVA